MFPPPFGPPIPSFVVSVDVVVSVVYSSVEIGVISSVAPADEEEINE